MKKGISSNLKDEAENRVIGWVPEQRAIIELDTSQRGLVEAGPGSGKTAVACKRVAHLMDEYNLPSSNILLVSFTRAAIHELRERIYSYLDSSADASGVQIVTLDSFTWNVLRGFNPEIIERFATFETNIKAFIDMLKDEDEDLLDALEDLDHVIVDEAQDLVGDRADLVMSIIEALRPETGVTVFADSAQAIYGFTEEDSESSSAGKASLVNRLLALKSQKFKKAELVKLHRTEDKKLGRLYRDTRSLLMNKQTSTPNQWRKIRAKIQENAHQQIKIQSLPLKLKAPQESLILFRSRAEVLSFSSELWKAGIQHKIRMSGHPVRIEPWIAHLFGSWGQDKIDLSEFKNLWKSKFKNDSYYSDPRLLENYWDMLQSHAALDRASISLRRLRQLLATDRPPLDFTVDDTTIPGPTVGTIHSSKGRESEVVYLGLPGEDYSNMIENPARIAEEERVLFVGASRARKRLITFESPRQYTRSLPRNGRIYHELRGKYTCALVEIGRSRDFALESSTHVKIPERNIPMLQDWLWSNRNSIQVLEAKLNLATKLYQILEVREQRYLGSFTKMFRDDLFKVGEKVVKKNTLPGMQIKNLYMTGVSTAVLPDHLRGETHSPWCESGFTLIPIVSGYSRVFFNNRGKQ
ncbi:MAG: ATP-dependent helicase [Calditrichaeota bacterium]|nr:ATP-dependent helicase [Calditrichota bacterium]